MHSKQMVVLILVSPCLYPVARATDLAECDRGLGTRDWLWRVSIIDGEVQLAECLRKPEGIPLEWDAGIQLQCPARHLADSQ